ncbi:4'-phosphopantetheinyl transferase superfamily protein [Shewanella seohaensis]|uniref:4'-phosphopantetheinyl transferase family protein n=1 Tax=Shewanella seohaensis TaxID=755175 RepID=UPI0021C8267A|nr:4'-phosphopantetheinyl transferase superfamily protein [Shewanella seohaensis]UXM83599.1 4'-phosphopantetheinyl transferase superfamily protein [Shewanella seohaensis]
MRWNLTLLLPTTDCPQDWCFEYGAKGKPSLNHEQFLSTGIEFNLSHSGDWLLIALAQDDDKGENANTAQPRLGLGVDIERARASTHIYPILNHYFSAIETEGLLALEGEDAQRQRFFDLWALKESYIKATGLGLAQSLKSFGFDLAPNSLLAVDGGALQAVDSLTGLSLSYKRSLLHQAKLSPVLIFNSQRVFHYIPILSCGLNLKLHRMPQAPMYIIGGVILADLMRNIVLDSAWLMVTA